MSLNDPFGRVSRRQAQVYRRCREQLQQQGVENLDTVRERISLLGRNMLVFVLVVIAAGALAVTLFPGQRTLVAVIASLLLLWLGSGFLQTRSCLARYLNELRDHDPAGRHSLADRQPQEEKNR